MQSEDFLHSSKQNINCVDWSPGAVESCSVPFLHLLQDPPLPTYHSHFCSGFQANVAHVLKSPDLCPT